MDERALTPVVAKTLAAGLALLYVAGMTSVLLGGVVPSYEAATGEELSERALATTAQGIEDAVPAATGNVNTTQTIELPETIQDESYRIELANQTLSLDHPDDRLDDSTRLSLPAGTTVEDGTWHSSTAVRIRVSGPATNRTISIDQ